MTSPVPRNVLILFAHPALERSRINRRLLEATKGLEKVSVRDLYELYPDLEISIKSEQAALREHEVIVFQHPFYWYSVPPILKQWQDLVLEHGWAYGARGHQLDNKLTMHAITAGGPQAIYSPEGFNKHTVREFLAPWEMTANLCRMKFLAPFVVHGTHQLKPEEISPLVDDYRRLLIALRDETLDLERAAAAPSINAMIREVKP
jgi:glutathione-regulated potassium-efflux system ancillary protein KefG